jgi:predicted ATPase
MELAARQRGLVQALTHLVAAAAATVPRVIAIEDLHWADAKTLAHVAAIAKAVSRAPLVLMVTSRVDGDPLAGPWRAALHGVSLTTLDLGPLSDAEAQALAGGLISTSERFARKCVERAGGNPLFLTQLLRAAQEHEDRLPASLQSVVLARVDRLAERDRMAIRAASVIGQRFSEAVVRHLTGMPDFRCVALLEHRLVQPDGDDLLFSHALIRDGVYASLTRARRAALHLQAAQWYGDRDPALRAEHLDRAESPDAASAYRKAAELEAAALRIDRALSLAERGIALAADAKERCTLELLRGRAFREIGEGRRVSEAGRAALAAASTPAERCRALLTIAAGHRFTGEVDVALDALAQAETLARDDGLARERTQIHYLRGNLHFAQGRIDACRFEHALAYDEAHALGDAEHEARALSGLGDAAYAQGLIRTALARFGACLARCDAHGFVRIALPNRIMFGNCRMFLGEFDAAVADIRGAGDMAVRLGDRHAEMMALESEGLVLNAWGRFTEAVAVNTRARDLAEQLGARRYASIIIVQLAEVLLQQGRLDDARRELQTAMTFARETGIAFAGPIILGMLARVAGDPHERAAHVAEAEALLVAGCLSHNHFFYRRFAIDDALARRDFDEALRHADALERYANQEPVPYVELLVRRARTWVAIARDPRDVRAAADLRASRAEAEKLGWTLTWPDAASVGRESSAVDTTRAT